MHVGEMCTNDTELTEQNPDSIAHHDSHDNQDLLMVQDHVQMQ
jgi:hypothetical protein